MKIDEAISILKQYIDYNNPDIPDFYTMEEAIELIIKALEQEPCDNCISRHAALEAFGLSEKSRKYGGDHSGYDTLMKYEIQDILEDLPSVTAPQKMGKWLYNKKEDSYKCSLCGFPCHKDNLGAIPTNYCAGCGAKMSEIPTGAESEDKE